MAYLIPSPTELYAARKSTLDQANRVVVLTWSPAEKIPVGLLICHDQWKINF